MNNPYHFIIKFLDGSYLASKKYPNQRVKQKHYSHSAVRFFNHEEAKAWLKNNSLEGEILATRIHGEIIGDIEIFAGVFGFGERKENGYYFRVNGESDNSFFKTKDEALLAALGKKYLGENDEGFLCFAARMLEMPESDEE